MQKLPQEPNEGNQQEIVVDTPDDPQKSEVVKVTDVLIGEAEQLKRGLAERLESPIVAERVFSWLRRRLPTTLTLNATATAQAKEKAKDSVEEQYTPDRARRRAGARRPADQRRYDALAVART